MLQNKTSFHRKVHTMKDSALNANRFEKRGCKLDTSLLWIDRSAAGL
jgi:hypothetical protein